MSNDKIVTQVINIIYKMTHITNDCDDVLSKLDFQFFINVQKINVMV